MKRIDTLTPLLPNFLEVIQNASGVARIAIKPEPRVKTAAEIIGCTPKTVIRLIESRAIYGRRLTDRPDSMYKVCRDCCFTWRDVRTACPVHNLPTIQRDW